MKHVLAASAIALVAQQSFAADGDMRTGTFGIYFCGAPANFEVQSREGKRWVFEGKIRIHDTGEYDRISIAQYDDNSLSITRFVPGKNQVMQRVITDPPAIEGPIVAFRSEGGRGAGCNNPGAFTDLRIPR